MPTHTGARRVEDRRRIGARPPNPRPATRPQPKFQGATGDAVRDLAAQDRARPRTGNLARFAPAAQPPTPPALVKPTDRGRAIGPGTTISDNFGLGPPGGSGAVRGGGTMTVEPPRPGVNPGAANIRPITGNEAPNTIDPGRSGQLQDLLDRLAGMAGGGGQGGGGVMDALRQAALDRLGNSNPFAQEAFDANLAQANASVDRRARSSFDQLDERLAGRGVSFGNLASEEFGDLAETTSRFQNELLAPILRDKALADASSSQAAFGNALGFEGLSSANRGQDFNQVLNASGAFAGLEGQERGELRGERGFREDLRTQARDQAIEELLLGENIRRGRRQDESADLDRGLRQGNRGGADFDRILADLARQFGLEAGDTNGVLAQLAQLLGGA